MSQRGLVIGLFAVAMLVAGLIFTLLLLSVDSLKSDARGSQSASDLIAQSYSVELSVVDLETGLRGFLLTGQERFLDPLNAARSALPGELKVLDRLGIAAGDASAVRRIEASVDSYMGTYIATSIVQPGQLSPAAVDRNTARGKRLVDALRAQFLVLDRALKAGRAQHRTSAEASASLATRAAFAGLVVVVLLLALLAMYFLRNLLAPMRTVSDAAGELAAGDLDVRVPDTGRGEVGRLARSFNAMATALSRSQETLRSAVVTAEKASAMKSDFLANMSHEIRTPLNGVIGMITLLEKTGMTAEQTDYLAAARSSSEALLSVVSDVLDIAKIEAGRLEIEDREFGLHEMVEASSDLVAASALAKGLELQPFIHPDVPRTVSGDRTRAAQVLANLLSNAVKFTDTGEVALEVSAIEQRDDSVVLRFEIRDTGIGIAPGEIDRLFEPFTQAEVGTTRSYGGTGLGLTITAELVHLMGGTITATSTVGAGSSFRVEIPFGLSTSAHLRSPVPPNLAGVRILVLDDNATNRQIFSAYVRSWGMCPEEACSSAEAMQMLRAAARDDDPFDVALLDMNLPDQSGLDLAREITATAALARTKLILLTSSATIRAASESDTGIRQQLTKPVRQSRLLEVIGAALDPGHPQTPERSVEARVREPAAGRERSGASILVADDHPVNRTVITRLLEQRGHRVMSVVNGREAVETSSRETFDLLLMDCQMPVLDGYDATREIRLREGASPARRLPIVAMTANALAGAREACLDAGMDDYLSKPIAESAFDGVLQRWLGGRDDTPVPEPPSVVEPVQRTEEPQAAALVLDPERFRHLLGLFEPTEISSTLAELSAEIRADIAATREADSAADIASAAHRIKNSAGVLGAMTLIREAGNVEAAARANPETDGEMAADALEREFSRLALEIRAQLPSLTDP